MVMPLKKKLANMKMPEKKNLSLDDSDDISEDDMAMGHADDGGDDMGPGDESDDDKMEEGSPDEEASESPEEEAKELKNVPDSALLAEIKKRGLMDQLMHGDHGDEQDHDMASGDDQSMM